MEEVDGTTVGAMDLGTILVGMEAITATISRESHSKRRASELPP